MMRAVAKNLLLALVLLLGGCSTSGPDSQKRATAAPAGARADRVDRVGQITTDRGALLGFYLRGLHLTGISQGMEEPEYVGLIMEAPGDPGTPLMSVLSAAPIVATFRSVREGHAVSRSLAEARGVQVLWCRASFDGAWSFDRTPLPPRDPAALSGELPIGGPDVGLESSWGLQLYILPAPLQERGVAVAVPRPGKGYPLLALFTRDQVISTFTSWDDLERRLEGKTTPELTGQAPVEELPLGFEAFRWDAGPVPSQFRWAERHRLRVP